MKNQHLDAALKLILNPHTLVNLVSRRVRQLNAGQPALTLTDPRMSVTDIALKEIAESKITAEAIESEEKAKKKKK